MTKKKYYKILSYVFMFFAFSFVGYLWETGLKLVQTGNLVNSGSLYGPWLPIYGMGGLAVLILLKKFKSSPIKVFVLSLVVCTSIEYFCSCYLEFTKGIRYWDYSNYFININGRICLEASIIFGLAGALTMYIGEPVMMLVFKKLPKILITIICIILIILFSFDTVYSAFHPTSGEGISYERKK